jgi:hypothetical protein
MVGMTGAARKAASKESPRERVLEFRRALREKALALGIEIDAVVYLEAVQNLEAKLAEDEESFNQLIADAPSLLAEFAEFEAAHYTKNAPPSQPAETSQPGMRDDLHISLLAARRLAAYEVLVRESNLTNPELAQGERVRRAGHLLLTYDRLREVRPDFKDTNDQLTAARRIQKAAYRERQRAKRGLGPAVRGRPRKLHA